jgi:hypothetical protein
MERQWTRLQEEPEDIESDTGLLHFPPLVVAADLRGWSSLWIASEQTGSV